MNILLLGNGFDLYHKFPTKYINFVNTIDYLANTNLIGINFVGDVFGNINLQKIDAGIAKSYKQYETSYNKASLTQKTLKKLADVSHNIWFKYLLQSLNRDIGWIDFEKEIATVIQYLEELLREKNVVLSIKNVVPERVGRYILKRFNFLWENSVVDFDKWEVSKDYTIEYPVGSNNMIINKEKIIETLSSSVYELAEGLKLYLKTFVEDTLELIRQEENINFCSALSYTDYTITFNYTNTFEKFYTSTQTFHIHGCVDDKIVLGINPDKSDELETVDTTFIQFKKYHQRTLFETDTAYIRWLREKREERSVEDNHLLVMGHSLAVTDKDIITELFDLANDITILYHSKEAQSDYIANLVKIFGKDKFLLFRREKNLTFLPLDMDFTEFSETRASNQLFEAFADTFL